MLNLGLSMPRLVVFALFLSIVLAVIGCGGGAETARGEKILTSAETKRLLSQLPYRFDFRKVKIPYGASDAVAGRVYGRHRTWFDFGISLGKGGHHPVPVPPAGVLNAVGVPNAGFIYTDNTLVRNAKGKIIEARQIRTRAQSDESIHMGVAIEEKLCFAVTGEACPV